ncbi:hypothetical protein FRAAL6596 [Frankia alni ACN14a]|uniref:Uncharacterized protein n=1 Tax=Frankia alni (strain DSM 45986 / CECT 9034 / ACN14a) TaxID=326424 RepID=Q0RBG7_FRAAA|nr:hypothetical protein FRAAL6596 [Frankia alni ACN14a]
MAWTIVAILMVVVKALVDARLGPRGRPRAPEAVGTPDARPVPPSAMRGTGVRRFAPAAFAPAAFDPAAFDPTAFDPLADRMSCLLRVFLAAAVPRADRPARLDLRAPATAWFVDAFTAATDLLIGVSQSDRPEILAAAVREAERRWRLIDAWSRETAEPTGSLPAPPPGAAGSGRPRPDDPGSADHPG